ncbi:MAG: type VI secretion system-associated protein TagO [Gemmobacter sp.]|nr:type VI secretion system-associated protein TagO [Gemmobacter sp.]
MRFQILATALLLGAAETAAADPARCAAIAEPSQRLGCYDDLFRTTETLQTDGDWSVRIEKSQLDDSTSVYISLESQNPLRGRFGQKEPASLHLRCKEKTTVAYIYFGGHFMSDNRGGGRVDYRVDNRPAKHRVMDESNDNQALGLWSGKAAIPFIKELMEGSSLYIRATPFSESMIEATFSIAGLAKAIEPLKAACKW